MSNADLTSRSKYLSPKQASKIVPLSASYLYRHWELFGGMRVGGGESRTGRLLFTEEGIEQGLKKAKQHVGEKKKPKCANAENKPKTGTSELN